MGELVFRRNQRFNDQGTRQARVAAVILAVPDAQCPALSRRDAERLRDPLTGAGNRIAMEQTLQREIEMSRRHLQPLSVLMLDIDHFKRVNDSHGHSAGDDVLKASPRRSRANCAMSTWCFVMAGKSF
jgi:GGDEF domain-containing protein